MSELKRTNIMLPVDLKREARAKAIMEGKNLSQVVRELLEGYVRKVKTDSEEKNVES